MRLSSKAKAIQWIILTFCLWARAKDIEQQPVFVRGQDGYHTYRIPAVLTTSKGSVLAFCEGRKASASDSGDIDIVFKRSIDAGKTWGKQQIIWDDKTNTCGNPCVVQDKETGTIFLLLTHNLGKDHEKEINGGTSSGSRTVWLMKSDDDGLTWSAPKEITSAVKEPSWRWYATGPGIGIQIEHGPKKGRLIIPSDHSVPDGEHTESQSHVIYSDDHGKSWKIGGSIKPNMNECQVVELSDGKGTLLMSMRNLPKGSNRAQSISFDGGSTWSPTARHPQLIDSTCQASILRYRWSTSNEPPCILFSNPADSSKRINMTVRASYDEGQNWSTDTVLHTSDSAYSCLTVLPDHTVGCLYERGEKNAYEQITFARFALTLPDQADPKPPTK
ncbi:MAG: glycosyl hydrolase repeat-containing protein [Verrucomicrobiales bacterium]|nr:glycosyl hydrolase repeat-containing protein [Verrucomicrobiales bacterium]